MSSTFSSEMQRPSGAYEWQMPAPPVEPTPALPRESFRAAPLLAHEASYFAASARISSLCCRSISSREDYKDTKRSSGKMVTSTPRDMITWSGGRPVGAKPSSGRRLSSHALTSARQSGYSSWKTAPRRRPSGALE